MWFATLFLVALLPALVNGFPFYHADSAAYSGGYPLEGNYRTLVPPALSKLLIPIFGPWSHTIINATLFGVVLTRFASLMLPRIGLPVVVIAMIAAGVPMFTSAIMPDIWISLAYLSLITLFARFSWVEFLICVIATTGHGLNYYLLFSTMVFTMVFMPSLRLRALAYICGMLLCAAVLEAGLDRYYRGNLFPPKLGTGTIASKVLNDVPATVDEFCDAHSEERICQLRHKIIAQRAKGFDKDDQYIWDAGLMNWNDPKPLGNESRTTTECEQCDGQAGVVVSNDKKGAGDRGDTESKGYGSQKHVPGLTWKELNSAGLKLGWFVVRNHPMDYFVASLADYFGMFWNERCFPSGYGFVETKPENARWIGYLNTKDPNTLARQGFFFETPLCFGHFVIKSVTLALSIPVILVVLVFGGGQLRRQVLILCTAVFANDIAFALTSTGSARYHERMLMLATAVLLLALNHWRERRNDQQSPGL